MISNTNFQNLVVVFVLIIAVGTFIFVSCFPSLAMSIIAISMVATWIFPVAVVILSPDISHRNATIEIFWSLFSMLFMCETEVWHHNSSTSRLEFGGFAGLGRILLVWAGALLLFSSLMKIAYKANPDTRELDTTTLWPEVVRQCLRALRIHRQHKSDPEYQFLVSVSTDYIPLPFFP